MSPKPIKKKSSEKTIPPNAGRGGKRNPPGGRPPKLITVYKRTLPAEKLEDYQYALGLFIGAMRDDELPLKTRLDAAREVMDRIGGRPAQAIALSYSSMTNEQLTKFISDTVGITCGGGGGSESAGIDCAADTEMDTAPDADTTAR